MDKYERKYLINEAIPRYINEAKLSILLFDIKKLLAKSCDFLDFKELTNNFTLLLITCKFYCFSDENKEYLKDKVFNKINKNFLYGLFLRRTSDLLLEKDYEELKNMLKSFVSMGLVKQANYNEENKYISLVLNDDTKVNYLNAPLDKDIVDTCRNNCHAVSYDFLKNCDVADNVVVVLEDNELYGKCYHSFVLKDNVVYDLSHNLVISYENYLKLVNPVVLVKTDRDTFFEEIAKLELTNKTYSKSRYAEVLKYAMDTDLSKTKVKAKRFYK